MDERQRHELGETTCAVLDVAQYPEVSEWGVNASYVKRGWTYSDNSGTWLQANHPRVQAALIHINGGHFLPNF